MTERDLLHLVLAGVQQHVQQMRDDVASAADALEPLRNGVRLDSDVRGRVDVAAAGLTRTIAHLGELQVLLAAAAQSVVAREGAQRRWMRDLPPLAPSEGMEPEAPNPDPDSWSAT